MSRVVVIGDIGGHASQLHWVLRAYGATGTVPPGTVIVQVGDLIDRGPASAEVLELVDHFVNTQPAQWVQLVGNHEAQYLHPRSQFWPEQLGEAQAAILRRWWHNHQMHVAAAVRDAQGDEYLVTHAG
ncbi:metallophosphoesterase, partial [Rhizocola hellebori]|uniref:metallophosphoesterase n=1 Tax=Rhizocola hellebori TaxID=1392758 RepID=UPI0019459C57